MKQILISIKPKWVAKILNGEKTLEIRKTAPKEWVDYLNGKTDKRPDPIIVNIYCTKGDYIGYLPKKYVGKVVARFTLMVVERIKLPYTKFGCSEWVGCEAERTLQTQTMNEGTLLEKSCLEEDEIYGYLNFKHSPNNVGYAWHISALEIFDDPRELSEFSVKKKYKSCFECPHYEYDSLWHCQTCKEQVPLKRAPQSWCYVEELL